MNMLEGYLDSLRGMGADARNHFNVQMQRIVNELREIRSAVDAMDTREERFRITGSATADGTGLAIVEIPLDRLGYAFNLEYLYTVVSGGSASIGVAYLGAVEPANMFDVIDDADMYASPLNDVYVPQHVPHITVRITGAPANAQCVATIQGTQHIGNE